MVLQEHLPPGLCCASALRADNLVMETELDFQTTPTCSCSDASVCDRLPDNGTSAEREENAGEPQQQAQGEQQQNGKDPAAELASIMTATSNPVSPGTSSPPLDQARRQDFTPPTRPSSTPFPQLGPRSTDLDCSSCPYGPTTYGTSGSPELEAIPTSEPPAAEAAAPVRYSIANLPAEIHECILDHLFGFRVSATSRSSITRWGTALRHPRRRELSELALVSRAWRDLIQERLFRHIKLKASIASLEQATVFFEEHPHLRDYVKHVELWFPVFHARFGPLHLSNVNSLPHVTPEGLTAAHYCLPVDNCSLEEAFQFVKDVLPGACILTLEGGERKKAPKVRYWVRDPATPDVPPRVMPQIPGIRTLICRGQWNLIRSVEDFRTIMSALPNLLEWHGSYSKPKSKSYLTMAEVLPHVRRLDPGLTALTLCIEGDYRREPAIPPFFQKVAHRVHFCHRMAVAASSPSLENFVYTGRVCKGFFLELLRLLGNEDDEKLWKGQSRERKLRSIDLTVKNCCRKRDENLHDTGSGITEMKFIHAFEELVIAGIRVLGRIPSLETLRIRHVDLDSPIPQLNPYFHLKPSGRVTGVWSDAILSELARARPGARFDELSESFYGCPIVSHNFLSVHGHGHGHSGGGTASSASSVMGASTSGLVPHLATPGPGGMATMQYLTMKDGRPVIIGPDGVPQGQGIPKIRAVSMKLSNYALLSEAMMGN